MDILVRSLLIIDIQIIETYLLNIYLAIFLFVLTNIVIWNICFGYRYTIKKGKYNSKLWCIIIIIITDTTFHLIFKPVFLFIKIIMWW